MSTCIYMAALSINDNVMMFWAIYGYCATTLKLWEGQSMECKVATYLMAVAIQNSAFDIFAMTLDKYIAMKWPHKAAIFSSSKRAKVIMIGVLIFTLIYNIPHIFLTEMVGDFCVGFAIGGTFTNVYSWFSLVINCIVPLISLIYMNSVFVQKVRISQKMFRNIHEHQGQQRGQGQGQIDSKQRTMKNTENQLTIMLLLVTTLFLILMLPGYIRFVYSSFAKRDTPSKFAGLLLFVHVTRNLYFTNNAINFFLYCISEQKFRNDFKEMLLCVGRVDGHNS